MRSSGSSSTLRQSNLMRCLASRKERHLITMLTALRLQPGATPPSWRANILVAGMPVRADSFASLCGEGARRCASQRSSRKALKIPFTSGAADWSAVMTRPSSSIMMKAIAFRTSETRIRRSRKASGGYCCDASRPGSFFNVDTEFFTHVDPLRSHLNPLLGRQHPSGSESVEFGTYCHGHSKSRWA